MSKPKHKSTTKKPRSQLLPDTTKSPRVLHNPDSFYGQLPAWRIAHLEMCDPFGWHEVDKTTLNRIRERLQSLETMTWQEILVTGKKQNHLIALNELSDTAQKRLRTIQQDDIPGLLSLRLTGRERIWGVLENAILRLLWWDPYHKICHSPKKHT